jgi:hypothetical protein
MRRSARIAIVAVIVLAHGASTAADPKAWPPFLPPADQFGAAVVTAVEHIWRSPTLVRTATAETVNIPRETYLAFVDAPDLTASLARHLRLAEYEVEVVGADWYRADDHRGASGVYRVLVREAATRVILSWGSHRGEVLGTIRGQALSVMTFETRGERTVPSLTAYVVIENAVAAQLARMLAPIFGALMDRKLTEGFRVTAKVVEWALEDHARFCAWLATAPLSGERRTALPAGIPSCTAALRQPARPSIG